MGLFDEIKKIVNEPVGGDQAQDDHLLGPRGSSGMGSLPGKARRGGGMLSELREAYDGLRDIGDAYKSLKRPNGATHDDEPEESTGSLVPIRPVGMLAGSGKRYTFFVDISGSMVAGNVAANFSSIHKGMLDRIAQGDPTAKVTYVEYNHQYRTRYKSVDIERAESPKMDPSGGTDLPHVILSMVGTPGHAANTKDVFVIITDGDVEGYHAGGRDKAAAVIKRARDKGAEFWFLADAPSLEEAIRKASRLSIPADHVRLWGHTPESLRSATQDVSNVLALGAARE